MYIYVITELHVIYNLCIFEKNILPFRKDLPSILVSSRSSSTVLKHVQWERRISKSRFACEV